MMNHHIPAGIAALALALSFFAVKYFGATGRRGLPRRGWAGAGIIVLAEFYLAAHRLGWMDWSGAAIFFTPIVWTGYLLLADGMVWSLAGKSIMSSGPRRFWGLALWSIPLWLVFEAYNLRLQNWAYVGLPANPWLSGIGYAWSFATIWPGIYETAELISALGIFKGRARQGSSISRLRLVSLGLTGLLLVSLPVIVPARIGQYLFGAVWMGFILLLDPILYHWEAPSFLGEFQSGDTSTLRAFLLAGAVCGILWEFWNYWAAAKWLYVFPIGQGTKIFEMPLLGFLGFPAFALECRAMYEFVRSLENKMMGLRTGHTLETAQP